jgi:putative transposase
MPRPARLNLPDIPQHITQRGNNRQVCFHADNDYRLYLELLHEACRAHDCSLHAYVLMTNHAHLLMTPATPEGVSKVMRDLGRDYVRAINRTYRRTGTLWEGRFKSSLVDTNRYCLTCYRYIEFNPVRAGMVSHPADYPWSSYHVNARGKPDNKGAGYIFVKCIRPLY